MAKYTTQIRTICEYYAGYDESQGYTNEDTVIEKAREKVFDFNFPIYDESYRSVLETKILRHYYFNEIGFETVGMFKHYLKARLNEIMPYYNQLYKSELLEFNPLYDVDLTTDNNKKTNGNRENSENEKGNRTTSENVTGTNTQTKKTEGSQSANSTDWTYNNDTPQGGVSGLENLSYLTSATKNTSNSSGSLTNSDNITQNTTNNKSVTDANTIDKTGSETYKDTEEYLEHVKGKNGGTSYSKLLEEYRQTFLNIDTEIIDNLRDLFMLLW